MRTSPRARRALVACCALSATAGAGIPAAGSATAQSDEAAAPTATVTAPSTQRSRLNVRIGQSAVVAGTRMPAAPSSSSGASAAPGACWITRATDATGRYRLRHRSKRPSSARVRVRVTGTARARGVGRMNVYRRTFASWYGPGFYGRRTACRRDHLRFHPRRGAQDAAVRHPPDAAAGRPDRPRSRRRSRAVPRWPGVRPDARCEAGARFRVDGNCRGRCSSRRRRSSLVHRDVLGLLEVVLRPLRRDAVAIRKRLLQAVDSGVHVVGVVVAVLLVGGTSRSRPPSPQGIAAHTRALGNGGALERDWLRDGVRDAEGGDGGRAEGADRGRACRASVPGLPRRRGRASGSSRSTAGPASSGSGRGDSADVAPRLGRGGLRRARAARARRAASGRWSTTASRATAPTSTASASPAAGTCATATRSASARTVVLFRGPGAGRAGGDRDPGRGLPAAATSLRPSAACCWLSAARTRTATPTPRRPPTSRSPTSCTSASTRSRATCARCSPSSGSRTCRRTPSAPRWWSGHCTAG